MTDIFLDIRLFLGKMLKYFGTLFILLMLLSGSVGVCVAKEKTVTSSAQIKTVSVTPNYDNRLIRLRNFFNKYNSPLGIYSKEFIYWADYYNLDYRLIPSITGVESTFGKKIPKGSFNAYGWNNGDYYFPSWSQSIEHVSKTIRKKYYEKGADSIFKISRRYAPPSKFWAGKVKFFMEKIDPTPIEYEN